MEYCANIDAILSYTRDWYVPEKRLHDSKWVSKQYRVHPLLSRTVAIFLGFVSGALKPFFFPLWALVSLVALPIVALISRDNTLKSLWTWCITLLALGAFVGYMFLSAYVHPPAMLSASLLLGAIGASIVYHVHLGAREPKLIQSLN